MDPINPTDNDSRALACDLVRSTRFGAIGVVDATTGLPSVTRIALLWHEGGFLSLMSDLSSHSAALRKAPEASLLVGEPGPKGDPLTHPRMTLAVVAREVDKVAHRVFWLGQLPKSQLYFDFADFRMIRFEPLSIALNGGFGRAYQLSPQDLPN